MGRIIKQFLIFTICIILIGCTQETTEEYPNLSSAMGPGAAGDRGWLPKFVPPSSINIKITYIVETGETWLYFEADSNDLMRILQDYSSPNKQYPKLPRKGPASWWPESRGCSRRRAAPSRRPLRR